MIMKNTLKNFNCNLFLQSSDTELTKICEEVLDLGEKFPAIYAAIKKDQDTRGRLKKQMRLLDKHFNDNKTDDLPGVDFDTSEIVFEQLYLEQGRPRMKPELVLLFILLRGYFGSTPAEKLEIGLPTQ